MSNQGITRWERFRSGASAPNKYGFARRKGGMLSALDIRYTFDGKTQREEVHAVYPGREKPHNSKQLVDVPF